MGAQIIGALKQALAQGTLSEARVDEAVVHILELKLRLHLIGIPASSQRVGQSGTSLEVLSAYGRFAIQAEMNDARPPSITPSPA
jgi:hypothetical protein